MSRIDVTVAIDTDELRYWAERHADKGHAGVSNVLFEAAGRYEGAAQTDTFAFGDIVVVDRENPYDLPVGREAVVISRLGHRAGWYVLAWPNLDPESVTCATHACPAEALVRIRIRDGE